MSKNQEIAARVLKAVGGEGNVNSVVHCATRLRFKLKDENKADTAALNADPDVIQVVQSAGQYQVVIGSHVSDVYKDLMANSGLGNDSDNIEKESGGNIFNRLIDIISSIFTPFLGAMAGAGVLKGFLTLAVTMGWLADTSLAMALVHPSITALAGKTISFAGLPVIIGPSGYTSSVLPIILAVFAQSYVERFFKKVIPSFLQIICVPLAVFLIMAPVTFLAIGPIGTVIGDWLGQGYNAIYAFSPIIAGLLMGSLWQVLVMFGMHWGFVPIMMLNLTQGGDTMVPMLLPAVIAQGGAALAVFFLTKNVKLKGLALSSSITTIFGITEPTVYGVTLPLKKPFIAACIGGGIGGAFVAMNHVKNFTFGLVSMLSLPGFIPAETKDTAPMITGAIGAGIAFIIAFVLTFVLRFEDQPNPETATEKTETDKMVAPVKTNQEDKIILASPLQGEILPLEKVQDPVFASGALGKGVAIEPTEGKLYAPADGEITTLFPTGHAVGLTTTEGVELLMHIGMDTVELDGKGFELSVKQGDSVKKGDLLVTFDIAAIKEASYPVVTPIVVTNTNDYLDVLDMNQTDVLHGEDFLAIIK